MPQMFEILQFLQQTQNVFLNKVVTSNCALVMRKEDETAAGFHSVKHDATLRLPVLSLNRLMGWRALQLHCTGLRFCGGAHHGEYGRRGGGLL